MGRRKTAVELDTFRRHAERMSANAGQSPEDRERWKALAGEAAEHLRRDEAEDGLFAAGEVAPDDETLF